MHAALRPYVTAGVALVGASAIAVTPVAPTPPEIHIASPAVELTAAPQPLEFYGQVLQAAIVNVQDLVTQNIQTASEFISLARDDLGALLRAVTKSLVPLTLLAAQTFANPFFNTLGATVVAVRDVGEAIVRLHPVELVNAIVDVPGRIADGFLNGGYTASMGGFLSPFNAITSGPLGFPTFALFLISGNLGVTPTTVDRRGRLRQLSAPTTSTTDVPRPNATTVTLDATPAVSAGPAPSDPGVVQSDTGAAPQPEQAVNTDVIPIGTETTRPDRALRANHAGHPVLDNLREHRAERKAQAEERRAARLERRLAHAASAKRQTPSSAESTAP